MKQIPKLQICKMEQIQINKKESNKTKSHFSTLKKVQQKQSVLGLKNYVNKIKYRKNMEKLGWMLNQFKLIFIKIIRNSLQFIFQQCGVIYNFQFKMINNDRKRGSFKVPKRKHEGNDRSTDKKRIVYQMPVNLNSEKFPEALLIGGLIQKKSNSGQNHLKNCKQTIKKDHSYSKQQYKNSLTKKQSLTLFDMKGQASSQLYCSKSRESKQKLCDKNNLGKIISKNQSLYYQQMKDIKNKNMIRNYEEFYGFGYETCSIGLIEEINKIHNYNIQQEMEQIFHRLKLSNDDEFIQQEYRGVIKCNEHYVTQ